jgi:hypothetical protein
LPLAFNVAPSKVRFPLLFAVKQKAKKLKTNKTITECYCSQIELGEEKTLQLYEMYTLGYSCSKEKSI